MNEQQTSDVVVPGVKIVSVWAAVKITSWADAASAIAFFYTLLLVGEWLWKRFGRPFCENRRWIRRNKRRADDTLPPR